MSTRKPGVIAKRLSVDEIDRMHARVAEIRSIRIGELPAPKPVQLDELYADSEFKRAVRRSLEEYIVACRQRTEHAAGDVAGAGGVMSCGPGNSSAASGEAA